MSPVIITQDGSTFPELRPWCVLVNVCGGKLQVGRFNREKFCTCQPYLDSPENQEEIIPVLERYIRENFPDLLIRRQEYHYICPAFLVVRMTWSRKSESL